MGIPGVQALTDFLLPSLEAMGLLAYWVVGAASLLEAFFVTGIILPGSIIVDLGGVLVHRGLLDFFDLVLVCRQRVVAGQHPELLDRAPHCVGP